MQTRFLFVRKVLEILRNTVNDTDSITVTDDAIVILITNDDQSYFSKLIAHQRF
jgi:hypothetical protein